MNARMRAIVAAAGATALLGGCAEETAFAPPPAAPRGVYAAMRATELATIGAPGPADLPFGEALVTYSHLLGEVHAWEGERADALIREAIFQLATILSRMPAAAAQPSLRRAAATVRVEASAPGAEATRRALAIAATELLRLAGDAY